MLFSQERVKLKNTQSKIVLTVPQGTMLISQERVRSQPVKNKVNGTQGTMLISLERARVKITQTKVELGIHGLKINHSKAWLTLQGYNAFSRERARPKINKSKLVFSSTQGTMLFFKNK